MSSRPLARFVIPLAMIVFGGATARGGELDGAAVDAVVQEGLHFWQVPGVAVAVVRDDRVVYLKGFGVREKGQDAPVTPDTLFPLASCTKAFTTTALAMLADEGQLHWDDPVRQHVPFFHLSDPHADALVTLRDLVTHRTGVAGHDFLWYRSPWPREEVIRRVGRVKLKQPFRSAFQYQSTMFTAAGHAVETASGLPWEEFVRRRIFGPLGLSAANFTTTAALAAADHASGHRKNFQGDVQVVPWYPIETPEPAGSINASARDLARWVRFHLGDGTFEGKRLVSAANLQETHTPQIVIRLEGSTRAMNPDTNLMSYGMAWVVQDYRGTLLVSHAGAIDGFRAHLTLVPKERLGLVLLNNLERSQMNLALSNRLVDLLLGLPAKDWNASIAGVLQKEAEAGLARYRAWEAKRQKGTRPSRPLAEYAGTYEEPAYGPARVTLKDGGLVLSFSTFTIELEHYHHDTFIALNEKMAFPQVTFTLGPDGTVAAMAVSEPLDVEFRKVKSGR